LPALVSTFDPVTCTLLCSVLRSIQALILTDSGEKTHIIGTQGMRHWTWIYRRRLLRLESLPHFSVSKSSILSWDWYLVDNKNLPYRTVIRNNARRQVSHVADKIEP